MRLAAQWFSAAVLAIVLAVPAVSLAQSPPVPYGAPITTELSKKVAAAALAEAKKNGWNVAVSVVEPGGILAYFEKSENTQYGSVEASLEKARTSAAFRRPSKAFEDVVLGGKVNYTKLPGAVPLEGGLPLVVDGKIVGAIGISGATSAQDGICAKAGADTLAAK
jgi:glc operon protein GlcG